MLSIRGSSRRGVTGLCAVALAASLQAQGIDRVRTIGTEEGQFYPDVELPTIDGKRTLRLSELRGKRLLLLDFASW